MVKIKGKGKCKGCLPQSDGRLIPYVDCPVHGNSKPNKTIMKVKMYCIYLQYAKDKPFLFEFNHSRKLCQEYYEEHQLNKPAYMIIKVEVKSIKNK